MRLELVMVTARSAVFQWLDGGIFKTKEQYQIRLNDVPVKEIDTVVFSLYDLKPQTQYEMSIWTTDGRLVESDSFQTDEEFVTLDVKAFGAKGDGAQDDTIFIQAAIQACPPKGRVWIPAGTYRIVSLFLKSHIRLELARGAVLTGDVNPLYRPVLPGMIESYDEESEYNLGSWEGNPLPMYAALINGIHVEDVIIYGEGCIAGGASYDNWWKKPKEPGKVFRPRLVFLNHCERIQIQGVQMMNSPSWTLHPYFSNQLLFCDLKIQNPKDSPNTDGINPESCSDVRILGVSFDVGDDCIAIKSGKIYMGRKYHTPSRNIKISNCRMENGHGAVTIGSEMAGGVQNVSVESCYFHHTDRGIRIKTRRGRGKAGVIDQIIVKNIQMESVLTPITINSFYFCDPDGKTKYVQSREMMPAGEDTPRIGTLVFRNLICRNVNYAAVYMEGLPEKKMEQIVMENLIFQYTDQAETGFPILSEGVKPCCKAGCYLKNVSILRIQNVQMQGVEGEPFQIENTDHLDMQDI